MYYMLVSVASWKICQEQRKVKRSTWLSMHLRMDWKWVSISKAGSGQKLQCCTLHSGSLNVENRSAHKVRHRSNYVSQINVWQSADSHPNTFSFLGSDSFYIVRKLVSKQTLKLSACTTVLPILSIMAIFPILSIVSILPIFLRQ